MKFRDLKADEIDVRVQMITEKGCSLLLYKDARCDMNILDDSVGAENWQRRHTRDNANCVVSIWDDSKKQWIEKEDTGTESNTEKEKGQASDSFKRACVNWGIGRELYTAPFIWVGADKVEIKINQKTNKPMTYDKFYVSDIEISNKCIVKLSISVERTNSVVFTWNSGKKKAASTKKESTPAEALVEKATDSGIAETEKEYKCCDCGKPFSACNSKGREYSAGQVYHIAESNNTDGKARCGACTDKAGTRKQKG